MKNKILQKILKKPNIIYIILSLVLILTIIIATIYLKTPEPKPQPPKERPIYTNLESSINDEKKLQKIFDDFIDNGFDNGYDYDELKSVKNFYEKNKDRNEPYIRKILSYFLPFIESEIIIYEYKNNTKNLEDICLETEELFNIQENNNKAETVTVTEIEISSEVGFTILTISYKCKQKDNNKFTTLYDRAVDAVNPRKILYGENKIFLWYHEENPIELNARWLSRVFNLNENDLLLSNSYPDAIRIISVDKDFNPVGYKQFRSSDDSPNYYKYRYNKETFYIKDDKLYWTDTNQLAF